MNQPVENILDTEIPIWEKPTLPEEAQVIMLAKQFVEKYGCNMYAWYRLPLGKISSAGLLNGNSASVNGNGFTQDIAKTKVVPGYINISAPHDIRVANAQSPSSFAKFLILENDTNNPGHYIVQASGMYEFNTPHAYIPGQTYYLGEDGYPTTAVNTDATKVQKLFYVLDQKTIEVQVG